MCDGSEDARRAAMAEAVSTTRAGSTSGPPEDGCPKGQTPAKADSADAACRERSACEARGTSRAQAIRCMKLMVSEDGARDEKTDGLPGVWVRARDEWWW